MKKLIILLAVIFLSCGMSYSWIDSEGSTWTVTDAGTGWEIKDIQNDVHDVVNHAWNVVNTSSGPYHNKMWVWDSDLSQWIELAVSSTNADEVAINSKSQNVKSFLYGYSGTSWDRLKSDGLHYLYVRSSTDSVTQARLYDWNGSAWQTTDIYGLARSTAQDITIDRIEKMNLAMFGVARSTGIDLTVTRLEQLNLALFGVARSSGMDAAIDRVEKMNLSLYGVARSSGMDSLISEMQKNTLAQFGIARSSDMARVLEEMFGLSRSTGTDQTIQRIQEMDKSLYGVARSTGMDLLISEIQRSILAQFGVARSTDVARVLEELFGLSRSTGTDLTISEIQKLNLALFGISRSTDVAFLVQELYGLSRSTGTDAIISRLELLSLGLYGIARSTDITQLSDDIEGYLYGVARSTGIDTTISRLDSLLLELYGLSRSTDIAKLSQDIDGYLKGVARSTGTDTSIARLDSLLLEIYGLSRSTGTDAIINRLDSLRLDMYGVARSSGMDLTIQSIQEMNSALYGVSRSSDMARVLEEMFGLSRSTGTDLLIQRVEELTLSQYGVARSSGIDLTIQRLEELIQGLFGVTRSTGMDLLIDFIQSRLEHCDTNDVKVTSGIFTLDNSSGTPASVGTYFWNGSIWTEALTEGSTNHNLRTGIWAGSSQAGVSLLSGAWTAVSNIGLLTLDYPYYYNISRARWERSNISNDGYLHVETSTNSHAQIDNFPSDYPDSTAASSLSAIDTTLSRISEVVRSTPQAISPDYNNRISTGTGGKLLVSGNVSVSGWNMDQFSFYSLGGDSEVTSTWTDGIFYCLEGIPFSSGKLSRTVSDPTFQCSMSYGTTLYYTIIGVQ